MKRCSIEDDILQYAVLNDFANGNMESRLDREH